MHVTLPETNNLAPEKWMVGSDDISFWGSLGLYFRSTPHPVTVTTRIITFLVGNPYKPSFATVTGWGVDPTYIQVFLLLVGGCEFSQGCRHRLCRCLDASPATLGFQKI